MHNLASHVEKQSLPVVANTFDEVSSMIPQLVKNALLSEKLRGKLSNKVKANGVNFFVNFAPLIELDFNPRGNVFWKMLRETTQERVEQQRMENWVKAGNFEDAALFLEKRGKYVEAGKMRARGREVVVRQTSISIDLNVLLKQIAEQGIVAVYRCPHCGGKLKIGKATSEASLRVCEHCGSEIETMDLADFLKTALS